MLSTSILKGLEKIIQSAPPTSEFQLADNNKLCNCVEVL